MEERPEMAADNVNIVEKKSIMNRVLALMHHWMIGGMANTEIVDRLTKEFDPEQLKAAHKMLHEAGGCEPKNYRNGASRSINFALAEGLFKEVYRMNTANILPIFTVNSEDLRRLQGKLDPLELRDERSVSARLESMELGQRRMQDAIQNMVSRQQHQQQPGRGTKHSGQQGGGKSSVPVVVVSSDLTTGMGETKTLAGTEGTKTFADITAGGRQARQEIEQSHLAPFGERSVRSRTPSQKREREKEEEWKIAGKKKGGRKTMAGNSNADLSEFGEGAQAGSVQFYIGNTSAKSDKEILVKTLATCAAALKKEPLTILQLDLLTTIENPRSKCWRIMVPFKDKELMENSEMFPRGWKTRRFFGRLGGEGAGEKRMRVNADAEVQMIEEEARKRQEAEAKASDGKEGTAPNGQAQ